MKLVRRSREERSARDRDAIERRMKKERGKKRERDREGKRAGEGGQEKERAEGREREKESAMGGRMREENRGEVGEATGSGGYLPIIHARDRSTGGG